VNGFSETCIGNFEFFFNTSDGTNKANTSTVPFTITKDDINITLVEGNDTKLNRSTAATQKQILSVLVYDTDKNQLVGDSFPGTGHTYVTTNTYGSTSFRVDKSFSQTSTGSFLNDSFPNTGGDRCLYSIGPLRWRVDFSSSAHKATNSSSTYGSDFFITLYTSPLQVNVTRPDNETFRRNTDPIPLIGDITDDCGGVANVTEITMKAIPESSWTSCGSFTDNNNGTYNCTLNSPYTASPGVYNVTLNASKEYYNSSTIQNKQESFRIATVPELIDVTVNQIGYGPDDYNDTKGGWGEKWSFSTIVRDLDQGAFNYEKTNISLWIDLGNGYQLVNSTICYSPYCSEFNSTVAQFIQTFSCGNIGDRPFKFNVSDVFNYNAENTSLTGSTITIEKEDVIIEFNNQPVNVNRLIENGTLMYKIFDDDKNVYVDNTIISANLWVTLESSTPTSWDAGRIVHPNTTGYVTYDFNATCSYSVGVHKWRGGTYNDDCYKAANFTPDREFNITGQLKNILPGKLCRLE
jgi:5-hydroxyisourate hydrolase-like protein (transthyretin family)